jgi:hypothetical protein
MKIIMQELKEHYVLQTLEDGSTKKVMYEDDENCSHGVSLFPNDKFTGHH